VLRRVPFLAWLLFVVALVAPTIASGSVAAHPETRVRGLDLTAHTLVEISARVALEKHRGIGFGYGETASGSPHAAKAIIDPAKFRYLFGEAGGRAHNVARTAQNAGQFARIGVYNTDEGRALLQEHFSKVVADKSNITSTFTNKFGTFQVRESLFTGPGGSLKLQSTWQVLEGGAYRFSTAIPFGGQ
jgi:filamentous hemagglutinin